MKNITQSLKVITLALVLSIGMSYAIAWTAPTATPPGGNVSAPINTSATAQTKAGSFTAPNLINTSTNDQIKGIGTSGGLGISGLIRGYSNAIFDGNVGIGTTNPGAKLHISNAYPIVTGSDGMLKVKSLTTTYGSETVSLQTSIDGRTDDYTIGNYGGDNRHLLVLQPQGGNVGIGTANPGQKLSVAGVIESTSGGIKFPDGTIQTTASGGAGCSWGPHGAVRETYHGQRSGNYYYWRETCVNGVVAAAHRVMWY